MVGTNPGSASICSGSIYNQVNSGSAQMAAAEHEIDHHGKQLPGPFLVIADKITGKGRNKGRSQRSARDDIKDQLGDRIGQGVRIGFKRVDAKRSADDHFADQPEQAAKNKGDGDDTGRFKNLALAGHG